jgi:hypothetical protein
MISEAERVTNVCRAFITALIIHPLLAPFMHIKLSCSLDYAILSYSHF